MNHDKIKRFAQIFMILTRLKKMKKMKFLIQLEKLKTQKIQTSYLIFRRKYFLFFVLAVVIKTTFHR
jgi:hypothetical protein